MKQYKLLIVLGFIILFLSGCSSLSRSLPPRSSDPQQAWQQHQLALRELESWNLKGRLAIDAIEEAWTGSLRWTQKDNWFEILWVAPLGQGSVELYGNQKKVTLRLPKGKPLTATSAEQLLWKRLGWSLPVSGLRSWLLGLPTPKFPVANLALDSRGRLLRLSQGGWHIRYLDYTLIDGYELPRKIFFNNPKLRLRLVIDRWRLV